jgi:hypothetical protein
MEVNALKEADINTSPSVLYKDMIATPNVVGRSRTLTFSHATSYTCVCGLFCLTYGIKVIGSLKQDMWDSTYEYKDPS